MMRWFGIPRGQEPAASGLEVVKAPVGELCRWCHEAIAATDSGVIMDGVKGGHGAPWQFEPMPYHYECHARQVIGSLAHLQRRCSCFVPGATCTDSPEMTKREAARAALAFFQSRLK